VGVALRAHTRECGDGCLVARLSVDEQSALRVARVGRVRRVPPAHEAHVETEVVDDALREQAHEIGVPGESRVDALEGLRRDRGPAEVVVALEQEHGETGAGEVGGGGEAVVSAADDHDVVGHPSRLRGLAASARPCPRPSPVRIQVHTRPVAPLLRRVALDTPEQP
jgi:hypothetical protein